MSMPPKSPPPPKPEKEPTFQIGQKIGHSNHLTITKLLGRGGFGEVYLAREERAQRDVAVKVMLREHGKNKKLSSRFEGEYTMGSMLSHPSLVSMFDMGITPDGVRYIVMEYIDGVNLAVRMDAAEKEAGQYGLVGMMHIGWQLASLFAELHQRKVIHRDLKPSNIMASKDPTIPGGERFRLLDFGIAKLTDSDKAQQLKVDFQTSTGVHLGTIPLMSPESFKKKAKLGPEVDVYALGCILYKCIAGNYPFSGSSDLDIISHHLQSEPIPLTSEDPSVPADVAEFVHRMLAKDPAERPTMVEISAFFAQKLGLSSPAAGPIIVRGGTQQLQALLGDLSTGTQPGSVDTNAPTTGSEAQSGQRGQQLTAPHTRAARRRRQVVLSFGVGAAALLAIGLFVLRNVASTGSRPAATIPAQMAPPPAASLPSTPDLGAAVAIPISKPALEAPNKPDEKAPSLEKKRKKKKNGLLVND